MATAASPATVLVVDDNEGLTRLMRKVLEREGFSAVTANSGQEAIAWLIGNHADLLLLDLKLPDIEGKALVDHLAEIRRPVHRHHRPGRRARGGRHDETRRARLPGQGRGFSAVRSRGGPARARPAGQGKTSGGGRGASASGPDGRGARL